MLNEKQDWGETSLKGRMAESLVRDLLRECGNEVYSIGLESILPGATRIEESFNRNSVVGDKIRAIPDFFVIDQLGTPHLVEVKFRWTPLGHESDYKRIERIKNWWAEAIIIFVNCSEKPYFRVSKYPFLKTNNELDTEPIEKIKAFNIHDETLSKFEALVGKYMAPTLTHKEGK
jgi:hypothetical protein